MSSSPPVGAIAFGQSGIAYAVARLEGASMVLLTSKGLARVPLSAIQRWELPPKPLEPDCKVQLRNTNRTYRVIRLYQVFRGQDTYEHWAELRALEGKRAYWKTEQLEVI